MALRNEEIVRMKYELGYNIVGVGADVYLGYVPLFDRAVQPYLIDLTTTSSTPVTAAPGGAVTTIVLASNPVASPNGVQANAFVAGTSVVVDWDSQQETSIIQALNGLNATLVLTLAHTGTYSVRVLGAEQIIRDILTRLDNIKAEMTGVAPITAGVAALVGEVEFATGGHARGRSGGRSKFDDLLAQRRVARLDLAGALNIPYLGDMRGRSSTTLEMY